MSVLLKICATQTGDYRLDNVTLFSFVQMEHFKAEQILELILKFECSRSLQLPECEYYMKLTAEIISEPVLISSLKTVFHFEDEFHTSDYNFSTAISVGQQYKYYANILLQIRKLKKDGYFSIIEILFECLEEDHSIDTNFESFKDKFTEIFGIILLQKCYFRNFLKIQGFEKGIINIIKSYLDTGYFTDLLIDY